MPRADADTKARAEELYASGRLAEALKAYEALASTGKADPRVHLRMGDIARRLDDPEGAVRHYTDASAGFAELGFVIKAIAVLRMILHIDPEAAEARARLAGLCELKAPGAPDERKEHDRQEAGEEDPAHKLPKAPLFSDFTPEEFASVIHEVRVKALGAGEYLFKAGDHGGSIFFVAEGSVEITCGTEDGTELVLATLGDGGVFGEFGFFSNSLRSAGVRAATHCELLELTRSDLERLIPSHPRIRDVLNEFYKERVVDRLMAASTVFRPLGPSERKEMLRGVEPRGYLAGQTVVKEGEAGDVMYLIKEGRVSVRAGGGRGRT